MVWSRRKLQETAGTRRKSQEAVSIPFSHLVSPIKRCPKNERPGGLKNANVKRRVFWTQRTSTQALAPREASKTQEMIAMRFLNASFLESKSLNRNLSWGFPLGNLLPETHVLERCVLECKREPNANASVLGTLPSPSFPWFFCFTKEKPSNWPRIFVPCRTHENLGKSRGKLILTKEIPCLKLTKEFPNTKERFRNAAFYWRGHPCRASRWKKTFFFCANFGRWKTFKIWLKSVGEMFLSGLRGAKKFSNAFRIVFRILSQRALRDRLMSRGKTCLPTVSRQFLTRNYPRPNCLLKCLPNCLSIPHKRGLFILFQN